MFTVQLLLSCDRYAADLAALLAKEGCQVSRGSRPDFGQSAIVVADRRAFECNPELCDHPSRVVMVAPNDPAFLSVLVEKNIRSVLFDRDSAATAVLVILGMEIGHFESTAPPLVQPQPLLFGRDS